MLCNFFKDFTMEGNAAQSGSITRNSIIQVLFFSNDITNNRLFPNCDWAKSMVWSSAARCYRRNYICCQPSKMQLLCLHVWVSEVFSQDPCLLGFDKRLFRPAWCAVSLCRSPPDICFCQSGATRSLYCVTVYFRVQSGRTVSDL